MNSGIYAIRCLVNGRSYIGQTLDFKRRFADHVVALRGRGHHNGGLQSDWLLHGEGAFMFTIVEHVSDHNLLNDREQFWIDFYRVSNPSKGYNQSAGPMKLRSGEKKIKTLVSLPESDAKLLRMLSASERRDQSVIVVEALRLLFDERKVSAETWPPPAVAS